MGDMGQAFLRWLFFTVGLALVPILLAWLFLLVRPASAGTADIIGNGELLIIAVTVAAVGIGEQVYPRSTIVHKTWCGSAEALAVGVAVIAAALFGFIAALHGTDLTSSINVHLLSWVTLISAILASASCVLAAEWR